MSTEGLVRYNADRCERAVTPVCVCHCGGKLHGRAHSEVWIKETARQFDEQREAGRRPRKVSGDLFDAPPEK